MATARVYFGATRLGNGKVLVDGGLGPSANSVSSAELYDPASNRWSLTGNLATARSSHTATLLANGNVLVVGGLGHQNTFLSSAELYDQASNRWTSAGKLATARDAHTATSLTSGKVLVAGGFTARGPVGHKLASAQLYDPATNMWSAHQPRHRGRRHHGQRHR
jgi:N-acetylneuraminic acid mutarotase